MIKALTDEQRIAQAIEASKKYSKTSYQFALHMICVCHKEKTK